MAHIGRLVNLGIAKEAVRGAGAAATYWAPKTSMSVHTVADKIVDEESYNSIQQAVSAYVPMRRAEGDLEMICRANSLGLLLYNLFGGVSSGTAAGETAVYDHEFTLSETNNHQSLALTIDDPVQDFMYKLAMLDSLTISVTAGEFVMISASFRAKAGDETSSTADYTGVTADKYVFHSRDIGIKIADTVGGLGAASTLEVKSFDLNITKNVIDDQSIHSAEPVDIFNRQFYVDGTIEMKYDSKTYRDYCLDNRLKALQIDIKNEQKPLGVTPTYPELKIQMGKVRFDDWERTDDLNEIIDQTMTFVPMADPRAGTAALSSVILTNNQASY